MSFKCVVEGDIVGDSIFLFLSLLLILASDTKNYLFGCTVVADSRYPHTTAMLLHGMGTLMGGTGCCTVALVVLS